MDLSLTPLKNANQRLEEILKQPMNEFIRDGVIQRFEFTFELAWKTLKRYFKEIGRSDIENGPKPIIREAGAQGLITNVEAWLDFLEKRNMTSHIYSEGEAIKVFEAAKIFPQFVSELIDSLEKKNVSA